MQSYEGSPRVHTKCIRINNLCGYFISENKLQSVSSFFIIQLMHSADLGAHTYVCSLKSFSIKETREHDI